MKFYLLDDDKHIRMILKQIITDRELGTVCGTGSNGHEGLEDVFELKPDMKQGLNFSSRSPSTVSR